VSRIIRSADYLSEDEVVDNKHRRLRSVPESAERGTENSPSLKAAMRAPASPKMLRKRRRWGAGMPSYAGETSSDAAEEIDGGVSPASVERFGSAPRFHRHHMLKAILNDATVDKLRRSAVATIRPPV